MSDLPRVTGILDRAGLIDKQFFTDDARDRGTALHLASQMLDEGDLDWSSVDPSIVGRLRAYQKFKDEVKPEILAIEEEVRHPIYSYVGHLDRRVRIGGREGVLDLKPPTRSPWQALQVVAYATCFDRPLARWTLHLSDDGAYRLIEHKDRLDWPVFLAAVTIAAWKERNGI